jgi:hypothetical protein
MELTYEQSVEAAIPVAHINDLAFTLNVDYLEQALKEMRQNHSLRESAAVLNPSPFTHNQQQDLNQAKIDQLSLMLKLAKNAHKIKELTFKLHDASLNSQKLGAMFGI